VSVGDVTFYPAAEAIALLGDRGPLLADRIQIYRNTWDDRIADSAIALHDRQLHEGGQAPHSELIRARDILLTAAMFENDAPVQYANATTFTLIVQKLGGESGFIATKSRRRNGSVTAGSTTTDLRVPRPAWCGSYNGYNKELLHALVGATAREDVWRLFDALEWLRRASTDADDVDRAVDLVLMLTAVDFLLAHPGTRQGPLDQKRIKELLKPFNTLPAQIHKGEARTQIQAVFYVLNKTRNAMVHPQPPKPEPPYPFEQRQEFTFDWIADRSFMALLVARLVELGCVAFATTRTSLCRRCGTVDCRTERRARENGPRQ